MKTFLHLLFICFPIFLAASTSSNNKFACPSGSVTLTTQAEVDNFATTYPACTNILESLTIGPSTDITNLNGLAGITSIAVELSVSSNTMLTDVSGLSNIISIGDGIRFMDNPEVIHFPLFTNLSSIDGGLILIQNNDKLTIVNLAHVSAINLSGVSIIDNNVLDNLNLPPNITNIDGAFEVRSNPLLVTISNLNSLTSLGNSLIFSDVLSSNLPLVPKLTTIGGLDISNNENIINLPLFSKLNSITGNGGGITIQNNPKLTKVELAHISAISLPEVSVFNNDILNTLILPPDITTINRAFDVKWNPLLVIMSNLNSLKTIGTFLEISDVLNTDLPEFANLETIGTDIIIGNNSNIKELPSFSNLKSIGAGLFYIQLNPKLETINLAHVSAGDLAAVSIFGNDALCSLMLPSNISSISWHFEIVGNPLLKTISSLNSLTSVNGGFTIGITSIVNLPEFPNLVTVGGVLSLFGNSELLKFPKFNNLTAIEGLDISSNAEITELPSFEKLATISNSLQISFNPKLCFCSTPPICTYLSGAGSRTISNNKGYCLNEANVLQFCTDGKPTTNATTDKSICNTATAPLIPFTSSQSGLTFSWTNDNTNIGLAASGNGDLPAFTATNSGTTAIEAEIIAKGFLDGCLNIPDTFNIKINPSPAVSASSNSPICAGATLQLNEIGNAATKWSWTGQDGFTNTTKNPSISNSTTTNAGNYSVIITDANSCTNTQTISVVVNATPDFTLQSTSQIICSDSPFDLNGIGINGTSTLMTKTWHTGSPATTANQLSTIMVTPTGNTSYYTLLTDDNGCTKELAFSLAVNANCSIMIADPCSCADPLNRIGNTRLITHFHDVLSINTGIANQTITLIANPTNTFLNSSLSSVSINSVLGVTDASGVLKVDFFKAAGTTGSITISNGVSNLSFNLSSCDANICFESIPTMSQWGLLLFGLLILNLGVFFVYRVGVV